ncbi:MAG: PH domain-containing protein [Rhizomicrobium sp.]
MAGYVDSNLNPGEQVVYRGAVHWIVYLVPVLLLGFGIPLIGAGTQYGLPLAAAGMLAGAAAWIRQTTSEFAVTNRRVIVKTGLLSRRTIEINISRVESVQVEQDIVGRLFNYGAITVIGTGGTKEPFTLIDNPQQFRRMVQAEQG